MRNPRVPELRAASPTTPAVILAFSLVMASGAHGALRCQDLCRCARRVLAVRPEGANHQWRKMPPRELSIDLEADERLGWVTGRAGASCQRSPWAAEQSDGP